MFGDLELYRDSAFFSGSGRGSLLLPERSYRLTPVLCFQCPASEMLIFDPEYAQLHLAEMLAFAERSAEQRNGEALLDGLHGQPDSCADGDGRELIPNFRRRQI